MDLKCIYILVAFLLSSFVRFSLSETSYTATTAATATNSKTTRPITTTTTAKTTTTTKPTTVITQIYATKQAPHEPCQYYRSCTIGLGVVFALSSILNIILIARNIMRSDYNENPPILPPPDGTLTSSTNDYRSSQANESRTDTVYNNEITSDVRNSTRKSVLPDSI